MAVGELARLASKGFILVVASPVVTDTIAAARTERGESFWVLGE